jgi:hypothetical protein
MTAREALEQELVNLQELILHERTLRNIRLPTLDAATSPTGPHGMVDTP